MGHCEGEIRRLIPDELEHLFKMILWDVDKIREIRISTSCPLMVRLRDSERYIDENGQYCSQMEDAVIMTREMVEAVLLHICRYSIYAYEDEIRKGYLSVAGGHRVGLTGHVVLGQTSGAGIQSMKEISGMNIRIAHELKGVAEPYAARLYPNGFENTLIISPPNCGKTTLLRDMVRCLSTGNECMPGRRVGVVDERSEIGASYHGVVQNDLGPRTDVLDACPKSLGISMLIRSMSPEIIAVDELGTRADVEAIFHAANSGCQILATMHGRDLCDLHRHLFLQEMMEERVFKRYIMLTNRNGAGTLDGICDEWEMKFA